MLVLPIHFVLTADNLHIHSALYLFINQNHYLFFSTTARQDALHFYVLDI